MLRLQLFTKTLVGTNSSCDIVKVTEAIIDKTVTVKKTLLQEMKDITDLSIVILTSYVCFAFVTLVLHMVPRIQEKL